jgi:hypothetical protein
MNFDRNNNTSDNDETDNDETDLDTDETDLDGVEFDRNSDTPDGYGKFVSKYFHW